LFSGSLNSFHYVARASPGRKLPRRFFASASHSGFSVVMEEDRNMAFSESGYLLDATRPKLLWIYKFCKRNRLNLNCLLRQSIEQFAA